ncbi:MAG: hypothetical protein ACI9R3_001224 [Verrucomicrobiales bacterium]|jgi:hypothetical protein
MVPRICIDRLHPNSLVIRARLITPPHISDIMMKALILTGGALFVSAGMATADLIGFYPFDDAANPQADASNSANHLTVGGTPPTYESDGGFSGGAYHFDASGRFIAPIDINPAEKPALTLGAWVKTDSLEPGLRKIMGSDNGGWDRTIGLDNRPDTETFRYTSFIGNGPPVAGTAEPDSTENWSFVAAVYDDNAGEVTVYVDLDASTTDDELGLGVTEVTGFEDGFNTFSIGSLRPDNNAEGWVGFIDSVFVFDEALDAATVEQLRDEGPSGLYAFAAKPLPSENLTAFYSFNDAGSPLADDSGNGNTLTSAGADPTYAAAGGVDGGGYDFDGTQRLVAPVNVNPDAMPKMTMGAWVKTSTLDPGLRKVLGSDNGGWDRTIGLDNRPDTEPFRYSAFIGNGPPVAGTPSPESTDAWTLLVASHDQAAGIVTVFVDLDVASTDDVPIAVTAPASFGSGFDVLAIGGIRQDNATEAWEGSIDNVFIYDTTLTLGHIVTLRNEGIDAILAADNPNLMAPSTSPFGALGQVSGEVTRMIEIRNDGSSEELEISSAVITGQNASSYAVTEFPAALDSGMTGNIEVAFNSGGGAGQFEATLVITSNDESNPRVEIDLAATVTRGLSGLVGLYLFDDSANPLIDETLGGNDLQSAGADPEYQGLGGFEGGAYSFDGTQRLIAPININPDAMPELTMGAWVKASTIEAGLRKVIGSDNGGWDRTIGLDNRPATDPPSVRYTSFIGNGPPVADTPAPANTDDWTFFAATFNQATNEVTVYTDLDASSAGDALSAVTAATGFGPGFATAAIGGIRPDNANEAWQGLIDNVFFFNRVLDADEMAEVRDGGSGFLLPLPEIPVDQLLGFYPFDDPADPTKDASGNGNDLDATLAEPTYSEAGGFNAGAYEFDGQQRLVAPIDINPFEQPKLTMGAWVKTSELAPGLRKVMGHDNGGWDRTIGLDNRNAGDPFRYTSFIGNGRPVIGELPGPESTDDWTFFAAVYDDDNAEVTVYVDLDASTTGDELEFSTEPTAFGDGFPELSIGSIRPDATNEGWVGLIDNAFIFGAALSAEQITFMRDLGSPFQPPAEDPDLLISLPSLGALNRDPAMQSFIAALSNGGVDEILTISGASISGPDADRFTLGDVPASLAPGASGEIPFTFDSKGQTGDYSAILEVMSDDPSQPSLRLSLNVTVVPPDPLDPVLMFVTEDPFAGLPVNTGAITRQITVSNTGAAQPLVISAAAISGEGAASFSIISGPADPIAPGATGIYEIGFDPQGNAGTFIASLDLVSTNASGRFGSLDITATVPLDPNNLAQALIGFWSFDDPDNPLNDDSGKENTLEMDGSDPIYGADTGFDGTGGFEFLGAEHLIAPIDINPDVEPVMTWGAWVKATNIDPGLRKIMGSDNGGWDRTIGLDNRNADDPFRYSSFIGNGRPVVGDLPGPESEDDWTFIAAAYDEAAGEVTVYVDIDSTTTDDALVVATEPTAFNPSLDTFSIGSLRPDNTAEAWVGCIDNPFIFRAVLGLDDITAIRDAGSPLPGFGGPGGNFGFRITDITIGTDGIVTIDWDGARSNASVILESSADLDGWEEVADGIEETPISIPVPPEVSEIYFRLRLEP